MDCLEQNGRINQYTVSYESGRTGVMMVVTSNMEVTLTGLLSDEQYTVKVAASNDVGIGPFSPALVLLVPIAGMLLYFMNIYIEGMQRANRCFVYTE